MRRRTHWLRALVLAGAVACGRAQTAPEIPPTVKGGLAAAQAQEAVTLAPVEVQARLTDEGFDATGMGSYEHQLRDAPFSNDLISIDALHEDPLAHVLRAEVRQIAQPSPVDLATGDTKLSLRGFPNPVLRNGFVTMGASDMLNTSRTVTIQGALVPVLGRAAPGGIMDYITWRPRTTPGKRFDYSFTSLQQQTASMEITGPTIPKVAWHRVASDWSRRVGPGPFVATETRTASAALTWKHSPAASVLFGVDYQQVHATASPGIPEHRPATGQKIVGPYFPLADFNAFGPEAGVRRRTTAFTLLYDGQPHKNVAVRGGLEAWWRELDQDRFTTSIYNVALGRFEGTREPRHYEQPQDVQLAHFEVTGRFSAWGAEHKLMAAANHTWGDYDREELALSVAGRNALPASVRLFDPAAPDFSRPAFSRAAYDRVLTDREERARYAAFEVSHRAALRQGEWVVTSGLRQDYVAMQITDRRPGVVMPLVRDAVEDLTYHLGVNYRAIPSRLLLFATASTAFEPSARVDARTGRLQPNETTRGYEVGGKWRLPQPLLELSVTGYSLFNEDISRRNPLYDDPIFDANHTQPQLVASGRETFRGARVEGRWKPAAPWTVYGRFGYARAITTSSPDLPEEVGRAITRVPPATAAVSLSYGFPAGRLKGLSLSGSWSYIAGYVAQYEDAQRRRLDYPSYGLAGVTASYSLRRGKLTHGFGVSVRNVFNYDFRLKQARLGAGRELVGSYRLTF